MRQKSGPIFCNIFVFHQSSYAIISRLMAVDHRYNVAMLGIIIVYKTFSPLILTTDVKRSFVRKNTPDLRDWIICPTIILWQKN